MINETYFVAEPTTEIIKEGRFSWSAPSNIALVKYWGKKENQIPANPSLSFTLKECKTITTLAFVAKEKNEISFDLFFDGELKPSFRPKIQKFFERIVPYCPYLLNYHFTISTENTFPHSSGIASSASGMAALAVNILSLEQALFPGMTATFFNEKASFLARLGSGSACRSVSGSIVVWGAHRDVAGSSDLCGVAYSDEVHPVFQDFQDVILLVDKGEKQVSSSVGHELMHNHPYAAQRFAQAHDHISNLKEILANGDLEGFIALVESEALTLHAMMMTSMPYFILMKPNTLQIIQRIWNYRKEQGVPVCFTLDAGANVHLLFPKKYKDQVLEWINDELAVFCQNSHFIVDEMGIGALEISEM